MTDQIKLESRHYVFIQPSEYYTVGSEDLKKLLTWLDDKYDQGYINIGMFPNGMALFRKRKN